jgi:hypothetical protein
MSEKTFIQKFVELQNRVKVTKDQFNSFGKYSYWTVGDILADARPIANELGLAITIYDEIVEVSGRFYVKASATVTDGENKFHGQAFAREALDKKGMDDAQVTGSASSYARKYCLAGLLGLDGEKDADATNTHDKPATKPAQQTAPTQPIGTEFPPTEKQKDLIKFLSEKLGKPYVEAKTFKHASDLINRLKELEGEKPKTAGTNSFKLKE